MANPSSNGYPSCFPLKLPHPWQTDPPCPKKSKYHGDQYLYSVCICILEYVLYIIHVYIYIYIQYSVYIYIHIYIYTYIYIMYIYIYIYIICVYIYTMHSIAVPLHAHKVVSSVPPCWYINLNIHRLHRPHIPNPRFPTPTVSYSTNLHCHQVITYLK